MKLVQLLQHFEHLAAPLAQAVQMFAEEFGSKGIAGEIMREIGNENLCRMYANEYIELN